METEHLESEQNGAQLEEEDSQERVSRSKIMYKANGEDMELRKKLIESRLARKKTEEDAKILMNRLLLLKNEEQKVL